jgi:spoIIIJ-associated protein
MDYLEIEAPSLEEAVFAASAQLQIAEKDAQVQVLSRGRGGRVKVRVGRPGVSLPEAPAASPGQELPPLDAEPLYVKPPERPERPSHPASLLSAGELEAARKQLEQLLELLGTPSGVGLQTHLDQPVLQVQGEYEGLLIGKRGANLQALQNLLTAYLNVEDKRESRRLMVDVAGYRVRREGELMEKARLYARQVLEEGGQTATAPMGASERRLVHLALKEFPELESFSVGEGELKKVVIQKKG